MNDLVLVVGVGRSGTSLFAGVLGQLGFHIPQPEVQADETNPRGFGEPKWVVDFHRRLLGSKRMRLYDARPAAWTMAAEAAEQPAVVEELRAWLEGETGERDIVVKDPRNVFFLPAWQRAADSVGLRPAYVTMLRHPAQVLTSAKRNYDEQQRDGSRAAAWLNVMLETERVTRGARRAYVSYPALLADWESELRRAGERLDLPRLAQVRRADHPEVDAFVDPSLYRHRTGWEELDVPRRVREMVEETWALLERAGAGEDGLAAEFDRLHAAYRELYDEAEAIAQNAILAAAPRRSAAAAKRPASSPPRNLRARLGRAWRGFKA